MSANPRYPYFAHFLFVRRPRVSFEFAARNFHDAAMQAKMVWSRNAGGIKPIGILVETIDSKRKMWYRIKHNWEVVEEDGRILAQYNTAPRDVEEPR